MTHISSTDSHSPPVASSSPTCSSLWQANRAVMRTCYGCCGTYMFLGTLFWIYVLAGELHTRSMPPPGQPATLRHILCDQSWRVRTESCSHMCHSYPCSSSVALGRLWSSRASLQTVHLLPHATHHLLHSDAEAIARIFSTALSTAFSFHSLPASRLT